jgi:hypothetical protein
MGFVTVLGYDLLSRKSNVILDLGAIPQDDDVIGLHCESYASFLPFIFKCSPMDGAAIVLKLAHRPAGKGCRAPSVPIVAKRPLANVKVTLGLRAVVRLAEREKQ